MYIYTYTPYIYTYTYIYIHIHIHIYIYTWLLYVYIYIYSVMLAIASSNIAEIYGGDWSAIGFLCTETTSQLGGCLSICEPPTRMIGSMAFDSIPCCWSAWAIHCPIDFMVNPHPSGWKCPSLRSEMSLFIPFHCGNVKI